MKARYVLVCLICVAFVGCVPEHLKKYQKKSSSKRTAEPASNIETSSTKAAQKNVRRSGTTARSNEFKGERPSIYAVDEKTFRFSVDSDSVWDAALNVLMRNYNLTIVNKDSGVITTEWDTFFLSQDVFRNKVSVRIQRNARASCDVMIHNSVEKLTNGAQSGAVGAVWLPHQDTQNEVHRIVRNMAILLNEPPPYIPGGNVATGGAKQGQY